jgi:predicted small metal-binding protein
MAKVLKCRDTGVDCSWEGRADTVDQLMTMAAKHAAEVHGETDFTDEEIAAFKAAIRDE